MTYFDNVNPTLLEVIDPQAQSICEFGCGGGALARAVRKTHPQVHYVGMELMAEPLMRARDALDIAIQCDLNQPDFWKADNSDLMNLPPEISDHDQGLSLIDFLETLAIYWNQAPEKLIQQDLPLQYVIVGRKQ